LTLRHPPARTASLRPARGHRRRPSQTRGWRVLGDRRGRESVGDRARTERFRPCASARHQSIRVSIGSKTELAVGDRGELRAAVGTESLSVVTSGSWASCASRIASCRSRNSGSWSRSEGIR